MQLFRDLWWYFLLEYVSEFLYFFHHIITYLFPCEVRKFVSIQVTDVPMLRWLLHNKVDVCRAVEGMRDVDNLCVDHPAEAFLHCEVEGNEGDEPGHDVHRDVQVLHRGKTVTDINGEGVIALKQMDVQISYWYPKIDSSEAEVVFLSDFNLSVNMKENKLPDLIYYSTAGLMKSQWTWMDADT